MPGYARRYDRFDRPIHRVRRRRRSLLSDDTPSYELARPKHSDAASLPANKPKAFPQGKSNRAVSDSFRPCGRSPAGTRLPSGALGADLSETERGSKRRRLPDTPRYSPIPFDSYKQRRTGLIDSYRPDTTQDRPEDAKVKGEPSENRSWFSDLHGSPIQYENTSSRNQPRRRATDPIEALSQAALSNETAYTDRPVAVPVSRKRLKLVGLLKERKSKLEDDIYKATAAGADEQSSAIAGSRRALTVLTQELQVAQQDIHFDQVATSNVQKSNPPKLVNPQRIQDVKQKIFTLEQIVSEANGEPNTAATKRGKRFLVIAGQELQDLENGRKVPVTPKLRTPRERYEQVRKMEQRQAQKNLKALRDKQRALQSTISAVQRSLPQSTWKPEVPLAGSDDEEDGGINLTQALNQQHSALLIQANDLKQALHASEVDNMYCASSPRNQPYICLFGCKGVGSRGFRKAYPEIGDCVVEIEHEADVIRTTTGKKPPFWYEIDRRMRHGTLQEKAASELNSLNQLQMPVYGGKVDAIERSMDGMSLKGKHDWMEEEQVPAVMVDTEDDEDDEDDDE